MNKLLRITLIFIVCLIVFIIIIGNTSKNSKDKFYYNRYGKVVAINMDTTARSQDKFNRPLQCGMVLVRDMVDTTLFVELSTCYGPIYGLTKEWYYNKHINDSVYFSFIRKDHYFHIKR